MSAPHLDPDNPAAVPCDARAEGRVLARLLDFGQSETELPPLVRREHFWSGSPYRELFDAFAARHAAGQPCQAADVAAVLNRGTKRERALARDAIALAGEFGTVTATDARLALDTLESARQRRERLADLARERADLCNLAVPVADTLAASRAGLERLAATGGNEPARPMVEFLSPSACREFTPPEGWNIVGSYHVQRGSPFVIGGAPGVGKSRAANALAVAGATRVNWFGLTVHRRFKTMILQAENGRVRLKDEFSALDDPAIDEFIRVCPPPPFGFAFDRPEFCKQLAAAVAEFQPDVFIVDPWNRATADDKSKDYLATFTTLLSLLPTGENAPALGIVAHTRKPQAGERSNGRGLLNILAGGYALGSVPRAAFVIQHASDDPEEKRVVWTCCKNNDGKLGPPSAWERANGLFTPVEDFDWREFDAPAEKRRTIQEDDVAAVFSDDQGEAEMLSRKEATARLMKKTHCGRSACYDSLDTEKGKFKARLSEKGGLLTWK